MMKTWLRGDHNGFSLSLSFDCMLLDTYTVIIIVVEKQ